MILSSISIFCSSISAPPRPADSPRMAADFPMPGSRFGTRGADWPRTEEVISPEHRRARIRRKHKKAQQTRQSAECLQPKSEAR